MAAVITNAPKVFESAVAGAAPQEWFDTVAVDGDRGPWVTAPVGSRYCKKSATVQTWYTKMKADGRDDDWVEGAGLGCLTFRFTRAMMTDGGAAVGTYAYTGQAIPVGAHVLRALLFNVTGFTGNVSAALTLGDGTTADRYNTSTIDVFSTAAALTCGDVSGTAYHAAAKNVTVTITSNSDFTSVTAGAATVRIYYLA